MSNQLRKKHITHSKYDTLCSMKSSPCFQVIHKFHAKNLINLANKKLYYFSPSCLNNFNFSAHQILKSFILLIPYFPKKDQPTAFLLLIKSESNIIFLMFCQRVLKISQINRIFQFSTPLQNCIKTLLFAIDSIDKIFLCSSY